MTLATDALKLPTVPKRLTLEEYLNDATDRGLRHELENGIVVEMGAENPLNPSIAVFLLVYLLQEMGVPAIYLAIGHQLEVRSSNATARQPDLMVHTAESHHAIFSGEKILRLTSPSPLLVVEVASQTKTDAKSKKRDYETKPREYADRGIPEMWIIDPERSWIQVGRLVGGQYQFETFTGDDAIESKIFPQLNLTAAKILTAGMH
jgi:Uma2 family endonuclease